MSTEHDPIIEEVAWGSHGQRARVFTPGANARLGDVDRGLPTVVEVHGGAWASLDRRAGERYNRMLARAGFLVVAIDFRMGPSHEHPAASDDVGDAVEWVRANHRRLGADPNKIALVGSSSGGHLALLASLDLMVGVRGVAALWPPLDPDARRRYASTLGDDHGARLVSNTDAYFRSPEARKDASIAHRVAEGRFTQLPPLWIVHPERDRNVPRQIVTTAADAYQVAGGDVEIWEVADESHGFAHRDGPNTGRFDQRLVERLTGWLG